MFIDRRRYVRVPCEINCRLTLPSGDELDCSTVDMSVGGVGLTSWSNIEVDMLDNIKTEESLLTMFLTIDGELKEISLKCRITCYANQRIGLFFIGGDQTDAQYYLQHLVSIAPNSDIIIEEIRFKPTPICYY